MKSFSKNRLHLVSFNVPYPADNGGLIDVFCKIKALYEEGASIILHCYSYGREKAPELEKYCEKVFYYERKTSLLGLFKDVPYIVYGRRSDELVKRLAKDDYPVILEGLHCSGILDAPELAHKKIFVRTHNIEHDYYRGLAEVEANPIKKQYYLREAGKLEEYEDELGKATGIFAISKADAEYFTYRFLGVETKNVAAFHLNDTVEISKGMGTYALYHGSLDVGENNFAALKLVNEVFSDLPFPLVIAGRNPSSELQKAVTKYSNITLEADVTTADIKKMVSEAQVNVLPTWQSTGIKLKLLMALYCGRHCVVNDMMVKETGLEILCQVANTPEDMKKTITEIFGKPFTEPEIELRTRILESGFSNKNGAKRILSVLFS